METTSRSSGNSSSTARVQVGDKEYVIDVEKIPYFESFLKFQQNAGQNTESLPTHNDVPFFDVINNGTHDGFRQFFRRMPTQLSDYHVLCETLEFLAVDVLGGRNLHAIMQDMRKAKSDWDREERREIKGLKTVARDSAFRLMYVFLLGEFGDDVKDSNMAFNITLFVVSHPSIFRYRTRKMIRAAFEERFCMSDKQRRGLDKWPIDDSSSKESQEEDSTTTSEESDDFDFDSDWS
ncbi:hypothetical protein DL764_008924 [Monosporascus ibericus]|uniref:Uncharacterized protein n=1 Tax=Monosporascus ibericus TaxID=155417 RepID=A0A4Q4SW92_9PEZI|nr:hypothetical protein DL764_008924 [Monosporascus ibericus]